MQLACFLEYLNIRELRYSGAEVIFLDIAGANGHVKKCRILHVFPFSIEILRRELLTFSLGKRRSSVVSGFHDYSCTFKTTEILSATYLSA